ncbi:MAG: 4-hydroxy-tetrahydrodipicolinate synthase [Nitrososphaerota archaeon]|nr:4-hydroxy-tetrahydrodipicolinate synthase [Candidatus Bathyarchaeota archaeon]MDW8048304.1 4-hydroxy-tetrahydrodipicolinate synthase [Nitrososphaerota archaeon]
MESRFKGCYTAIITPMTKNGRVDYDGLKRLVEFQIEQGVSGILAVGTTGESPTLTWKEHLKVIEMVYDLCGEKCLAIGGTGSNNTQESIEGTRIVSEYGVKCILLVDPYYNGPSSLEIRREYIEPIATEFPDVQIIPYVIPGRTGTQLLPQDLAILHKQFDNINAVKEATGNLDNMRLTRKLCGEDFDILSGDDDKTFEMMKDQSIRASGVISVASNVAPGPVQKFTRTALEGNMTEFERQNSILKPLFSIVTVRTEEETPYGPVQCRARNPLPYKTLMNLLGMPAGPCRRPLGKMTRKGFEVVLNTARTVYEKTPEILAPIEEFFDVDLSKRLYRERYWRGLFYD